jgi:hypothetical protein
MPDWVQWVIAVGAIVTALGIVFKKVILPGYRGVGAIEDALPVFREFTATFKGKTDVFKVIYEIAAQFRTDSGSSLRDAVDQLGQYAEANRESAQRAVEIAQHASDVAASAAEANRRSNEAMTIRFEAGRQLDEQRALQQERLMLQTDRLMIRVDQMMLDRAQVATDLTAREKKIDEASSGVASDLAAARSRADETMGDAGAAADAASQSESPEA